MTKCFYNVISDFNINQDPDSADLKYPRAEGDHMEVMFTKDTRMPVDQYITLMVIPLGLMMILPCTLI